MRLNGGATPTGRNITELNGGTSSYDSTFDSFVDSGEGGIRGAPTPNNKVAPHVSHNVHHHHHHKPKKDQVHAQNKAHKDHDERRQQAAKQAGARTLLKTQETQKLKAKEGEGAGGHTNHNHNQHLFPGSHNKPHIH